MKRVAAALTGMQMRSDRLPRKYIDAMTKMGTATRKPVNTIKATKPKGHAAAAICFDNAYCVCASSFPADVDGLSQRVTASPAGVFVRESKSSATSAMATHATVTGKVRASGA